MHVGHDIVTIVGNRAGTMLLLQVTIPALLGARRKSGCGHWWWWSFTRAQILNSLYAKLVAKEQTLAYIMSNLDIIPVYDL